MKNIKIIFVLVSFTFTCLLLAEPKFFITQIKNETNKNLTLTVNNQLEPALSIPAGKNVKSKLRLPITRYGDAYMSPDGAIKIMFGRTTLFNLSFVRVKKYNDPLIFTGIYLSPHRANPLTKAEWKNSFNTSNQDSDEYDIQLHFIQDANGNAIPVDGKLDIKARYR